MHPLNGKIFLNEKTSSLIWTKGAEMHTQFQAFSKKFFEKIYPFTCSHWEAPNYRVFLKNFLSGKIPLTYLELRGQNAPCFSEKRQKNFFEKTVCLKIIPSLVPTGRGHLGIIILKKDKKYARRFWRAKRIPIGVLPMGKNVYRLILKR